MSDPIWTECWLAWTDHTLVRVSMRLVNWPRLAGYRKFNTSLLEIRDSRNRLESVVQRPLLGQLQGISGGDLLNIG